MTKQEEKTSQLTTSIEVINKTLEIHGKNHDLSNDRIGRLQDENVALRERVAKLEQMLAELKSSRDIWGQRAWSLTASVVSALLGGVIGYLIKR